MSSVVIAGNTSGTVELHAPDVSGSSVLTLPVATDTLVGKATTDTLTNKTLTAPVISSFPTTSAPAYVKGAIYFDTTLNKLRVGGATAWETITSV